MDPNQTWRDLSAAIGRKDWATATGMAESLILWLTRGGFPPELTGVREFDRIAVNATCQAIATWSTR